AAEHLLPAGAAQVAGMAIRERSPRGRRRTVSRPADVRGAADVRVDVHARPGRARVAVTATRRDPAGASLHGRARAVRAGARVRGRSAVAGAGYPRALLRGRTRL